jgi:S1-C subfamily serine protease
MIKKTTYVVVIVLIAGLSGVVADRYIFPYLANSHVFSKYKFFKKAGENVTVINKTEQIYVKEESSVNKITNQIVPSIVNIASYPEDLSVSFSSKKIIQTTNSTGEIMTSDGIIMTTASAIIPNYSSLDKFSINTPGRIFRVMTNDGNTYDGKLLSIDSWSDLAFLKIDASNLPILSLGNSDEYNPGEKLISISNNSSQYQNKFATGMLSSFEPTYNISGEALSRAEKLEGVFLTDFNANILASGGPIIDYAGQTIGIVSSTIKNGNIEYFQIPSNKIRRVLDKVIEDNLTPNISLGLYYLPITKSLSLANDLSSDRGALIYSASAQQGLAVISGSSADKAGLRINDIIVKINDIELDLKNNLSDALYKYKKGDEVEFTIFRVEKEMKIKVQF